MFYAQHSNEIVLGAKYLAAGLSMGFGAIGAGLGTFRSATSAVIGMSRQPSQDIMILRTMLITQAVTEAASIFALVVACLLLFVPLPYEVTDNNFWFMATGLISAGLAMGLGAIGGGIGMGLAGSKAVEGVSRNPSSGGDVQFVHLLGSAVAGNPAVFGLVVSLLLMLSIDYSVFPGLPKLMAILGAGFSIGLGAIGSGIGCGFPAAASCLGTAKKPKLRFTLVRTMLIGQAVAQSVCVFALVVALLLLYTVS
jgi:F-type H+-transporting ATPase subunit c